MKSPMDGHIDCRDFEALSEGIFGRSACNLPNQPKVLEPVSKMWSDS
jgi:hypothetical protein